MQDRYLLYIDILGFGELARSQPNRVHSLYKIIDDLNVHSHEAFKTIVFSDTILVYSKDNILDQPDNHNYCVMFSCEFAQDLLYRLIGTGIAFRAVLTYGKFDHYLLNNIECFFGDALVTSYIREKAIKCCGLFIDNNSQKHNEIFPVARYDSDISFVFLNQGTEAIDRHLNGVIPIQDAGFLEDTDDAYNIARDIVLLKEIYDLANGHPHPDVRLKYLAAWNFQVQRYPKLLYALVQAKFNPNAVFRGVDWKKLLSTIYGQLHRSADKKRVQLPVL